MFKIWKKIPPPKHKNIKSLMAHLKKNKVILNTWIENIYQNKINNIILTKKTVYLYKVKIKNLGFKKPATLNKIYRKIIKNNFRLVNPDVALRARLFYKNQKKGDWLRFATPMNSMIDTDGVPHLPKLGSALNKNFIETYWAYKGAIFHPHNEFVVSKYDF